MSKYIGDVSAYAYAVSKGYTGTEEEFAELMADYADVGQRAEDAAESALNSKTAAQTAAQTATTKASEASTSATNASGSATAASASASAASGSATSAANSATAASGSATSAAGSATTASTKASEASASATDAATAKTSAEAAQTAAETAQGKAEDAQEAAEDAAESVSASAAQIATNAADITQLKSDKADIIISTAEGAIATFEDGGDDMPMMSCAANIEPVQSGSGDPSPDNVRPITGWTGASVVVSPTQDTQDGTTYPISWQSEAGTVYGGTVDLVSGVLTVTHRHVDLGTLSWGAATSSGTSKCASQPSNGLYPFDRPIGICSGLFATSYANRGVVDGTIYSNAGAITVRRNSFADQSGPNIKTVLSGVQFVYELAEPVTYQLTPVEVKTLLGLNNVWADTGDVEVQYRADTKLYIDGKGTDWAKLIAPTEAAYTATRAYTSGSLIIVGSQLYKATTAIANGATLTVGTNITATTLAEVIAAL